MQLRMFDDIGGDIIPALSTYDRVIVAFSGGKDSLACLLHLIELGVPTSKIELWHHDVDGHSDVAFMDWPCTPAYCRAIAQALDIPIYFSWKEGGFEREMFRNNTATAPTLFETPTGLMQKGGNGPAGTRWKFPQVSGDLRVRWCSAYLKIDVMSRAITGQDRFKGSRTLVVTGERAEESPNRARYKSFESHRDHRATMRHIDHWRPVHAWTESQVWEIIQRHRINPHPAYKLGWGRVSCAACIFGSNDQWASLRVVLPKQFERVASYEALFGVTIHRSMDIETRANLGRPYAAITPERIAEAQSLDWDYPAIVEDWILPAGAFGESTGPI